MADINKTYSQHIAALRADPTNLVMVSAFYRANQPDGIKLSVTLPRTWVQTIWSGCINNWTTHPTGKDELAKEAIGHLLRLGTLRSELNSWDDKRQLLYVQTVLGKLMMLVHFEYAVEDTFNGLEYAVVGERFNLTTETGKVALKWG